MKDKFKKIAALAKRADKIFNMILKAIRVRSESSNKITKSSANRRIIKYEKELQEKKEAIRRLIKKPGSK